MGGLVADGLQDLECPQEAQEVRRADEARASEELLDPGPIASLCPGRYTPFKFQTPWLPRCRQ